MPKDLESGQSLPEPDESPKLVEEYRGIKISGRRIAGQVEFSCAMSSPRIRKLVGPTLEAMHAMINFVLAGRA
ncbi:MAG TPA: hypothetical protein VGN12_22735 [Pirellulales bacterium]|jgi:hypothetical protein